MTTPQPPTLDELRDWFAGQALTGILANPESNNRPNPSGLVVDAYFYADQMLAERAKKEATT